MIPDDPLKKYVYFHCPSLEITYTFSKLYSNKKLKIRFKALLKLKVNGKKSNNKNVS